MSAAETLAAQVEELQARVQALEELLGLPEQEADALASAHRRFRERARKGGA